MARLIYSMLASLDGYIADEHGNFDFAAPDEEVHAAVNDLQRSIGTLLLGRRMYEVLVAWETMDVAGEPAVMRDFAAMWRATDKIVYSRTLGTAASARTRIDRDFDAAAVGRLVADATRDLGIGGPEIASQAFAAGLIDECHLFVMPVIVGGGKRALPDGIRMDLDLVSARRFAAGAVHLHYRTSP